MNTLEVKKESFTKHYRDELLPPIFIDQGCSAEDNLSIPAFVNIVEQEEIINLIDNSRLTLLLATDQLINEDIIQALQRSADKGIRIYLYLGDEHKNKVAISALSSRCLIRTGKAQQGAVLISDHATFSPVGHILNSSTVFTNNDDDDNFFITLTADQIQDTYRSFCHLFWVRSEKQIIKQGEKSDKAVGNPAGTIVTNHEYQLPEQLSGNFTQANDIKFSQLNQHQLDLVLLDKLLQATNNILDINKAELAEELINNNKNVVLTDFNIPNIVVTNSGCWFIPDGATNEHVNWSIKLNHQQSAELADNLHQIFEAAQWQLDKSCSVDNLDSQFRFIDDATNVYQFEESLERELAPVYTENMNSFLNDDIEDLTSSHTDLTREYLAKTIHYNVQRHPPYCPQSASKAKLYNNWESENKNWLTSLDDIELKLERLDEKRTSVSESILSFFNSFSLGQQHKHKKLKKSIIELRKLDMITATPAQREEQEQNYFECFNQLSQDDEATDQAIDKAKLEKLWVEKKEQLTKSLQNKEDIYSQEQRSVKTLKESKKEKYTQASDEFTESRDKAIETLLSQQADEKKQDEIKKTSSMSPDDLSEWLKNTPNKSLKKVLETYTQRRNKIKRDLDSAQKKLENASNGQATAKESLNKHGSSFSYNKKNQRDEFSKQLGINTNKNQAKNIKWPDEALPFDEEFELLEANNQRYLTFSSLNSLEKAKQEAVRLKANLCASKQAMES